MPYSAYWERLEAAYRIGSLPSKAAREAHLAEIRSVRLITLNYCPMNCTFCSATNFLHEAQGSVAGVARLDAAECMSMIERIVAAHPTARTIIFQDDIFTFTRDRRVLPLCEAIVEAKQQGRIPAQLQFISTNRIDAMTDERLTAMRRAGFRVLGFGIESFSERVLVEFNKSQIFRHIEPMLSAALAAGMTPFLDLILSSPRAAMQDVVETLRGAYHWMRQGCEIGMYPLRHPVFGRGIRGRPEPRAPHPVPSPRGSGDECVLGAGGEDSAGRPDGARRHFAYREEFRLFACRPRERRGASAVAHQIASVDPERHPHPVGVRALDCR